MGWIKTSQMFDERSVIFSIPLRHRRIIGDADELCEKFGGEPAEWESIAYELVLDSRPELRGCVVVFVDVNYRYGSIDIGVTHESLPRVPPGCERKRVFLDKSLEESSA